MSTFTCTECDKSFTTPLGLAGHSRLHGASGGTNKQIMCCCVVTKEVIKASQLDKHISKLEPCLVCDKPFRRRKDHNYCSASCAATSRNFHRHLTPESESKRRTNISKTLKQIAKTRNPLLFDPEGPYSKVRFTKCRLTGKYYVSRKGDAKCASPFYTVSEMFKYRRSCSFKFSLKDYPQEFDCQLPLYSAKLNPNVNAYSRDHMFSVADGFRLGVNSQIIAHPANCRLITQKDNLLKRDKSCITLQELLFRISGWESKYSP